MAGKRKKSNASSSCMSTNQPEDDATAKSIMPCEIPEDLYQVITEAASLRTSLKTNKNDKDLKEMLDDKEETIYLRAMYYKAFGVLPSSWEYNPETALSLNLPMPPKPPKKKKIKKIPGNPPNIKRVPLNKEERKVWMKFKTIDEAIEANECVSFPMDKRLVAVKDTDPLADLIGEFAVDAFNKSYQTYVNDEAENNVTKAVFYDCKYYKLTSKYNFYITIEAIEQGKLGVYEAVVECDSADGARTLDLFILTKREPVKGTRLNNLAKSSSLLVFKYEKGCFSNNSPDSYKVSGMVRRTKTLGGGFNYHNPSSSLHRYVLYDGRRRMYR